MKGCSTIRCLKPCFQICKNNCCWLNGCLFYFVLFSLFYDVWFALLLLWLFVCFVFVKLMLCFCFIICVFVICLFLVWFLFCICCSGCVSCFAFKL